MAAVIHLHTDLRVPDNIEIVLGEIRRDNFRYEWLDFGNRFLLESGLDADSACRNSGAAADHEDFARTFRNQCGQMAEHSLETHIGGIARRLHFAGVVIIANAIRQIRHGNGCR